MQLTTIFTPDTILRWHRELVAQKFDSSDQRQPGRPRLHQEVVDAIVRIARENPTWGYDRIQGALANLGYDIADSTVANVLNAMDLVRNAIEVKSYLGGPLRSYVWRAACVSGLVLFLASGLVAEYHWGVSAYRKTSILNLKPHCGQEAEPTRTELSCVH